MQWSDMIKVLPEGVNTLSKRPSVHVEGVYPKFIIKGDGCNVWDENGKKYIDFPCSLGAVVLGHNNEPINKAIRDVITKGTLFSLEHPKVGELAELISGLIPSMETMRFLKTGSESCSAAVRIARAFTGRDPIICCGYHGWHEWINCTTPKNAGSVQQDVTSVEWGDLKNLERLLEVKKPAAFITEPYIYATEPEIEKWLKESRRLCTVHGTLLIFDENVTGFRTKKLTAQNYWNVKPDLTCLGKAMANGIPMACVGGRRDVMKVLEDDCFVSSTFGGDLIGIVAAIAAITQLKQSATIAHIWQMGAKLKTSFNNVAKSFILEGVRCIGLPPRTHFLFPTSAHKSLFWAECLKKGVFFGHAQFASFAHNQFDVDTACAAMSHALKIVMKNWKDPEAVLGGKPAAETLRTITVPAEKVPVVEKVEPKKDSDKLVGQIAKNVAEPSKRRGRPAGSRNKPK